MSISTGLFYDKKSIVDILKSDDRGLFEDLVRHADETRKTFVGDAVHLRGLVECSNRCSRECLYCGIRSSRKIPRYAMTHAEIMSCAEKIVRAGFGTLVLQAGEGFAGAGEIAALISEVKERFDIAVTLSLGEYSRSVYQLWKDAGADRYLLRFETSQPDLYPVIHPGSQFNNRIRILADLKEIGYEAGTGIMVGIPGQTWESIAEDLCIMRDMHVAMIGIGPYIPHPDTPLGKSYEARENLIVPNSPETVLKVLALARLLRPDANIPSTTALSTLGEKYRRSGLQAGANIIMPNMTPLGYRKQYEIYPAKNSDLSSEDPAELRNRVSSFLASIGRVPGKGKGGAGYYAAA